MVKKTLIILMTLLLLWLRSECGRNVHRKFSKVGETCMNRLHKQSLLQTFNWFVCLSINFDLSSDISAWIKALGPGKPPRVNRNLELSDLELSKVNLVTLWRKKVGTGGKTRVYPEIRVKRVWVNEFQLYVFYKFLKLLCFVSSS